MYKSMSILFFSGKRELYWLVGRSTIVLDDVIDTRRRMS
jgi:hypothetical protein